jgi:alpha-glucosidase
VPDFEGPDRNDTVEWWRGAAIYQIYPRSFADSNGDGIGDLPGITAHLDHVARLGVDAIWISPFFTSPMADYGYDVADYRDVDPTFGTLADFDALVARAHDLGLKVTIDSSLPIPATTTWFAQSRSDREKSARRLVRLGRSPPDGTPPNNWQSVFGGPAWTWDARRRNITCTSSSRNSRSSTSTTPRCRTPCSMSLRFWLDRGVDGFRLDALNHSMFDPALTDNPPRPTMTARAPALTIIRPRSTARTIPMWSALSSASRDLRAWRDLHRGRSRRR